MKWKSTPFVGLILTLTLLFSLTAFAADPIQLPGPKMEGGKPLMQALKDRMSSRSFGEEKLSMQTLSNLLWAAFGVNRSDGRRTAPSAKNWQEIDIYVAMPEGAFLWDHAKNVLVPIEPKDIRALTGTQTYVKDAAINLVYVADYTKVSGGGSDKEQLVGGRHGFHQPERLPLLCFGRAGDGRPGRHRQGCSGQDIEAQA